MRIGVDALLLGRADSGVEIYIRSLLRALHRFDDSNEYVVYLSSDAEPLDFVLGGDFAKSRDGFISADGRFVLRTLPLPCGRRVRRILFQQMVLPRLIEREGVDIFFSPCYVMPLQSRVPVVVTMHDMIALKHPRLCKPTNAVHYRLTVPLTARRCKVIVASSEATKRDIISTLGVKPEKVRVVYPAVDEQFKPVKSSRQLEKVRRGYALPDRYILFVGNIEPKKNLVVLIRAFGRLKKKHTIPHKLVIVGKRGWKCADVFEAAREEAVRGEVVFTGYVPREHLPAIYSMADVFVFPSIVEGFGMPPLEAMACGVPVVTSRAQALHEAVGDAAIRVPHSDIVQLSIAMQKILFNSFLRNSLIERGLRRARSFTWKKTARAMMEIFESLRDAP